MSTFWMEVMLLAGLIVVVAAAVPAMISFRRNGEPVEAAQGASVHLVRFETVVHDEELVVQELARQLTDAALRDRLHRHVAEAKRLLSQASQAVRARS